MFLMVKAHIINIVQLYKIQLRLFQIVHLRLIHVPSKRVLYFSLRYMQAC